MVFPGHTYLLFLASCLSTYAFSSIFTSLPYNLVKGKLNEFDEQTFNREDSLHLARNEKHLMHF